MFTGIVEELGHVEAFEGTRLRIAARQVLEDVKLGDSIAVSGCCLTVVAMGDGWWEADVSQETLDRTSLRGVEAGRPLNLERSVRLHDRLGGHLVSGHVDGLGTVHSFQPVGESHELVIDAPQELAKFLAYKGSVVVNGVSLTVNRVEDLEVDGARVCRLHAF